MTGPVTRMEHGVHCVLEGLVGLLRTAHRLSHDEPVPDFYHQLTSFVQEAHKILKSSIIPHCSPLFTNVSLSHNGIRRIGLNHHAHQSKGTKSKSKSLEEKPKTDKTQRTNGDDGKVNYCDLIGKFALSVFNSAMDKLTITVKQTFHHNHRRTEIQQSSFVTFDFDGGKMAFRVGHCLARDSHLASSSAQSTGAFSELPHPCAFVMQR